MQLYTHLILLKSAIHTFCINFHIVEKNAMVIIFVM